ncbi:MAG: alpha/beta fold hydrolase [Rhodobacteraceae bacterium]|nr:alpha/beta fold hydrolase [Paracoccaceae bacterium]
MLSKVLRGIILTPLIYLLIAGGLILSQWPQTVTNQQGGLDFTNILAADGAPVRAPIQVQMRDGSQLPVRQYGAPDQQNMLVLIHGSGWHGMQFDTLAIALSDAAFVVVPDLRGHGIAPQRRGDIDHIGQYEEDIADLIDALRQDGQTIVVAGHSSGGGLVVRMAGGAYGDRINQAVLIAPYLHYNAPNMRPNAGGWTRPLTRRLIGLSMLNMVAITALNHLDVIQLAMPQEVLNGPLGATATTAYTYRLNTSYAPRDDFLADIAMLPPFLLIVGRDDEAFLAESYTPLLSSVSEVGSYHIVENVGHLDIVNAPETATLIREILAAP